MKILIKRKYDAKETLGSAFVVDDNDKVVYEFKTLELPLFVVPYKINSHDIDCIPEGVYEVHKTILVKKGKCFEVMNVPDRFGVLIHIGNYAAGKKVDTQGCILVGDSFLDINGDGNLDLGGSGVALAMLWQLLPDKFKLKITKQ